MKRLYGRYYCCHSLVTEHVGSNKRSVGCREIEFLLPGNKHHIIFIFVLLFLFFCFRKLTNKRTGPRDWRILFLYNYDNYLFVFFSCFFVSVFFFDEEKLTKKGAGPGDWGGILLLYNYDNYLFFSVASFSFVRKN